VALEHAASAIVWRVVVRMLDEHLAMLTAGEAPAQSVPRPGILAVLTDMKAQIEQVVKNVNTCLSAGGATVNDIIFTISQVKDPGEFEKYAELRARYFGPPSPESATVPVSQLADPDFLVQIEAFAAIK